MSLTVAQLPDSFRAPVRSASGAESRPADRSFDELLANRANDPPVAAADQPVNPEAQADSQTEAGRPTTEAAPDLENEPVADVPTEDTGEQPGRSPTAAASEAASSQEAVASLAAAILAELQPLTIHSLNTRLLQAASRTERQTLASSGAPTEQPANLPVPEDGVQAIKPKLHRYESFSRTEDSGPSAPPPRAISPESAHPVSPRVTEQPSDDRSIQPLQDKREPQPATTTLAQAAVQVARTAASAAAAVPEAVPASHAGSARSEVTTVRTTSAPPVAAAPATGAQGRNPGGGAQLPRSDVHTLAASASRRAASARTEAMVTAQAARGLAAAMNRQDGAVTLRLNPESLGFLRIKLELGKGAVVARFEASTEQARRLLEQSSETLRASLEAKGWEASQVRVELLREVDPAADMLRRLEQFTAPGVDRQTAQEAPVDQERGERDSGGDRDQNGPQQDSSAQSRDEEPAAMDDPVDHSAMSVIGIRSRLDTIV